MYIMIYIASAIIVLGLMETITIKEHKRDNYILLCFALLIAPITVLYVIGKILGKQFQL